MSAEDAISNFNLTTYQQRLAQSYSGDAEVMVTPIFKMKVAYTFPTGTTITEAQVKPSIALANGVAESDVTVTITSGRLRRLGEARRLQSVVEAEIAAADQASLSALQTTMEQNLTVGGTVSTAGDATVEIDLVTTVIQPSVEAAVPPSGTDVQGFLGNITVTSPIVVGEVYNSVRTRGVCSDFTCGTGQTRISDASTTACAGATCVASDSDTCCADVPTGQANGAETISAHPFVATLVVFASSLLFC